MEGEIGHCALPDQLVLEAAVANAWVKRLLRWCITGLLPNVSSQQQKDCFALAFSYWAEVCQLDFAFTADASTGDLRLGSGSIDGRGGTLGWSELPNGADGPLRQQYDTGESWSAALDVSSVPPGLVPLLITAAHEIGHGIGLGHSSDPRALMYPTLTTATAGRPQEWDIREAQARYGVRIPPPAPPPGPLPGEDSRVVVIPARKVVAVYAPGWTLEER